MPSVERGECLNVGVVFCRRLDFLDLRTEVDERRLTALAPGLDLADVEGSLAAIRAVVCGDPAGGALAARPHPSASAGSSRRPRRSSSPRRSTRA